MIKYREAEEMKDSGVEWLGEIPKEWFLIRVGLLFELGRGRVISKEEIGKSKGLYPVYSSQTKNNGELGRINTYDFAGAFITWTTDGAHAGTVFKREGKFNCTNVCGILKSRRQTILSYTSYMLSTVTKRFVRQDINPKLMNEEMQNIQVLQPNISEQKKIANFLDIKTAQFDRVIEGKEKLIDKLEEAKKSLISEVVTGKVKIVDGKLVERDLFEMKDSGVEWLGMVPKEWESARFKRCLKVVSGKEILDAEKEIEKKIEVYGSGGVFKATSEILHKGESVLFGRKGTIGKPLFVNGEFWTVDTMYYTTYKKDAYPRFFYYQFLIFPWVLITTQTALPSIVGSEVENLPTVFPSRVEMEMISAHLDKKLQKLEVLEYKTTQQIQKLKQAKQSLVSEAVTGKIDLRDWEIQDIGE